MKALRGALGFLTVLPVRGPWPLPPAAIAAFPLAGLVIGLGWALAAWGGLHLAGPAVAAALVLAVDFGLTGGLHLDGFADTADGLASRRSPKRAREVMKDPSIGAVGAAALTTTLILRFALLTAVLETADWWVIALVPATGRLVLAWLLRSSAPREGSLANGPAAAATCKALAAAAILTGASVAALGRLEGLAAAVVGLAAADLTARWWRRRLGDSGDTIGAGAIVAETAALTVLAV